MRLIALLLATIACVAITAADSAHHNPNAALPSNNDIPRVDVTPTTPPTLHPEGKAIQPDAMKKPLVLVLGSAGFIGTYLVQRLEAENYAVLHVRNRSHVDLREPGSLDRYVGNLNVSFVYFLACEVGGSKFIDSPDHNVQLDIIQHNVAIYQNVFSWLSKNKTPFIFTSSYLQSQATSYGAIKRLGEAWIKALGFGKIVRLWNIYGRERVGLKSHVLADWVNACSHRGTIRGVTSGHEARQFLHAQDAARAFVQLMRKYADLDPVTDISSGVWVTLRALAMEVRMAKKLQLLAKETKLQSNTAVSSGGACEVSLNGEQNGLSTDTSSGDGSALASFESADSTTTTSSSLPCPASFTDVPASVRARVPPRKSQVLYGINDSEWQPQISLRDGIVDLFRFAESISSEQPTSGSTPNPYSSVPPPSPPSTVQTVGPSAKQGVRTDVVLTDFLPPSTDLVLGTTCLAEDD